MGSPGFRRLGFSLMNWMEPFCVFFHLFFRFLKRALLKLLRRLPWSSRNVLRTKKPHPTFHQHQSDKDQIWIFGRAVSVRDGLKLLIAPTVIAEESLKLVVLSVWSYKLHTVENICPRRPLPVSFAPLKPSSWTPTMQHWQFGLADSRLGETANR